MKELDKVMYAVLGHEVIHAYHISNGMMAHFGRDWSEYYAFKYSASIPYTYQSYSIEMMKSLKLAARWAPIDMKISVNPNMIYPPCFR